jgi:ankyrin repeat protein
MADGDGNTVLHYAISHCNIGVVQALLDTGVCDVRRQNRAGYTVIMLASLLIVDTETHRDVIKRLFTIGDVNVKSATSGQTALMLAASHGRCDMIRLLVESGADVNARDEDGSTALMCACEHGYIDIVEMLLSHPACDSTLTDVDGSTALSIAMDEGHRDIGVLLYAHMNAGHHASPAGQSVEEEETL